MNKKFIKLLSAVTTTILASSSVFASDYTDSPFKYDDIIEITQTSSVDFEELDCTEEELSLAAEELKILFSEFEEDFNANIDNFSAENLSIANEMIKVLDAVNDYKAVYNSDYDANKAKLRQANFIEGILDVNEGLTETQIANIFADSETARKQALNAYPSSADANTKRDAFRHFSWNNLSTKRYDSYTARTATTNHEWGIVMLNPMLNYYDNTYNEYINNGKSSSYAATNALAETVAYIPKYKKYAISLCQSNYSYFKSIFSADCIMDLTNNCYGRTYATKSSSLSYTDAFNKALSNGEVILGSSTVTNSHYYTVWNNDWYTY